MDLAMSALHSEADIRAGFWHVCFVPKPEVPVCYSITFRLAREQRWRHISVTGDAIRSLRTQLEA